MLKNALKKTSLLFLCLTLMGADYLGQKKFERSKNLMGSSFQITVFESILSQEVLPKVVDDALKIAESLEDKLSSFKDQSLIARINQATEGQVFDLDADTFNVLNESMRVSRLSQGAFDNTVWPLKTLWRKAKEKSQPPTDEEIQSVLPKVGYQSIEIDPATKKLTAKKEGVQIDLGGIGKGYAVDKMAEFLIEKGVTSAIVNGGGNLRFIGFPQESRTWRVGIEHPRRVDEYVAVLEPPESFSISTSGDYEDFFIYKGQRYGHIFDPRTGSPPKNRIVSVTIISKNATLADGLSTAFLVLGPEKGFEMIEGLKEEKVEAVCVEDRPDGKLVLSSSEGASAYLRDIKL